MRIVVLGGNGANLASSVVEDAFALIEAIGIDEANQIIVDGIREAPEGRKDVVDGWVALAQGIDAVAHATRH